MQRGSSDQVIAERSFQVTSELFQGKLVGLILFPQRIDREVQIPSLSAERAGQKWSANGQKATNQ
jgi:hypothetical protein